MFDLARAPRSAIVAAVAITLVFAMSGTALAAEGPNANAGCMGFEAAGISPPGSSEEFPGGMPAFKSVVAEEFPELSFGAALSGFAKLHEGSHEACDAAAQSE